MRQRESIEHILAGCLSRVAAGASIADCVKEYPEHAEELTTLLEAAAELRTWSPPSLSDTARDAARARAHAAFAAQRERRQPRGLWRWQSPMRIALGTALALIVVLGTLGISVAAAQSSLPGEPLYGLKRQTEKIQLQLASDAESQADLRLEFASRRLAEALSDLTDCMTSAMLLDDLANEYTEAQRTIAQLDPEAQSRLRAHFSEIVQEHQHEFDAARTRVDSACARADLERARDLSNGAMEQIITPTATLTSTPTLIASSTPILPPVRPTMRRVPTPTPTVLELVPTLAPLEPTATPTPTAPPAIVKPHSDRRPTSRPTATSPDAVEPTDIPTPPPDTEVTPVGETPTDVVVPTATPDNSAYPYPAPNETPTESTPLVTTPTDVSSEPTDVSSEPTDVSSEPTDVSSEPTDAPSEPTDAPSEPTDAPSEPTDAPSEEATSVPTRGVIIKPVPVPTAS